MKTCTKVKLDVPLSVWFCNDSMGVNAIILNARGYSLYEDPGYTYFLPVTPLVNIFDWRMLPFNV